MARVQSVDDKSVFVFVGDANTYHSERLESVSPTDRHGRDAINSCNLSGFEQLVRCSTPIPGNRLDLVMTDIPDIVDVVVGILRTSLQIAALSVVCFVSSSLCRSTMSKILFF